MNVNKIHFCQTLLGEHTDQPTNAKPVDDRHARTRPAASGKEWRQRRTNRQCVWPNIEDPKVYAFHNSGIAAILTISKLGFAFRNTSSRVIA